MARPVIREKAEMAQQQQESKSTESGVVTEIKALGLIVIIALALRATVVEAYIVPTGSMEKTIMVGPGLPTTATE